MDKDKKTPQPETKEVKPPHVYNNPNAVDKRNPKPVEQKVIKKGV